MTEHDRWLEQARGAETVWGHSVAELCTDAAAHEVAFADLRVEAAALDQY